MYILLQIRDPGQILSCLDPNFVKIGSKLTKLQYFWDFIAKKNITLAANLDIYGSEKNLKHSYVDIYGPEKI